MDSVYRLAAAFFLVAAALVCSQARAQYEYTGKVPATTGGQPPGTEQETAQGRGGTCTPLACSPSTSGPWYSSQGEAASALGGSTYSGCSTCSLSGGFPCAACEVYNGGSRVGSYRAAWVYPSNGAWGGWRVNNTAPTRTINSACPAGTSTGLDGLCYPLVCPSGTPAWESDPTDNTRCRRPKECDYPQRLDATSGECVCDSGTIYKMSTGSGASVGLAVPISARFVQTGPRDAPRPSVGCFGIPGNQGGCSAKLDSWSYDGTKWVAFGDEFTGETCLRGTSDAKEPETPAEQPCPTGQVRGEINGASVCVKAGETVTTNPPNTTSSTVKNSDGSTTTTEVSEESETVCKGGVCTTTITRNTTTTTRDNQGNVTGVTEGEDTVTRPGTRDGDGDGAGSSFGGKCEADFSCEGDAVQCAIALEQHRRNCQFWQPVEAADGEAVTALGVEALKGAPNGKLFSEDERALTSLNTTARIDAGACPVASSFSTPLGLMSIDWTPVCTAAGWFSWVIVSTALLIAARIVLGGL